MTIGGTVSWSFMCTDYVQVLVKYREIMVGFQSGMSKINTSTPNLVFKISLVGPLSVNTELGRTCWISSLLSHALHFHLLLWCKKKQSHTVYRKNWTLPVHDVNSSQQHLIPEANLDYQLLLHQRLYFYFSWILRQLVASLLSFCVVDLSSLSEPSPTSPWRKKSSVV